MSTNDRPKSFKKRADNSSFYGRTMQRMQAKMANLSAPKVEAPIARRDRRIGSAPPREQGARELARRRRQLAAGQLKAS